MKHNIIQMTDTAGLTVPHSIAWLKISIFTEKSSFQIKPSSTSEAMSINKIVAFGAQKIQTSLLKHTQSIGRLEAVI